MRQKQLAASWNQRVRMVRQTLPTAAGPSTDTDGPLPPHATRSLPRPGHAKAVAAAASRNKHHPQGSSSGMVITPRYSRASKDAASFAPYLHHHHQPPPQQLHNATGQPIHSYSDLYPSNERLHRLRMSPKNHSTNTAAAMVGTPDAPLGMFDPYSGMNNRTPSENGSRRHSVPVNQISPGALATSRPNPGRRMPSPNPACFLHRRSPIPNSTTTAVANTAPQLRHNLMFPANASSELDVSTIAPSHLVNPRGPSPSGFSHFIHGSSRRTLLPPATAPATRMPSPDTGYGRQAAPIGSSPNRQHHTTIAAYSAAILQAASAVAYPECLTGRADMQGGHMHDVSVVVL